MGKSHKTESELHIETIPESFTPSDEQIYALARRLAPEIKTLFVDEQIQQEFEKWKKKQSTAK